MRCGEEAGGVGACRRGGGCGWHGAEVTMGQAHRCCRSGRSQGVNTGEQAEGVAWQPAGGRGGEEKVGKGVGKLGLS